MTTVERDIEELKARLERLEAVVRRLADDEPHGALPTSRGPAVLGVTPAPGLRRKG